MDFSLHTSTMANKSKPSNPVNTLILYYLLVVLSQWEIDYNCWKTSQRNSEGAKKRRKKKRIPWSEVSSRTSNYQFRRMFRMSRECFFLLCQTITCAVVESAFKSESYIDTF